jgi:hypothetical protein
LAFEEVCNRFNLFLRRENDRRGDDQRAPSAVEMIQGMTTGLSRVAVSSITAGLALAALFLRWPVTGRRTIYPLGGALYLVLQADLWISPWSSPLAYWSLVGSTILTYAFIADMLYLTHRRFGPKLWLIINRLRRD